MALPIPPQHQRSLRLSRRLCGEQPTDTVGFLCVSGLKQYGLQFALSCNHTIMCLPRLMRWTWNLVTLVQRSMTPVRSCSGSDTAGVCDLILGQAGPGSDRRTAVLSDLYAVTGRLCRTLPPSPAAADASQRLLFRTVGVQYSVLLRGDIASDAFISGVTSCLASL